MPTIDVIGDIHGYADKLRKLLTRLRYEQTGGVYGSPDRKAIFVGDLIDRGPSIGEVMEIVEGMLRAHDETCSRRWILGSLSEFREKQCVRSINEMKYSAYQGQSEDSDIRNGRSLLTAVCYRSFHDSLKYWAGNPGPFIGSDSTSSGVGRRYRTFGFAARQSRKSPRCSRKYRRRLFLICGSSHAA